MQTQNHSKYFRADRFQHAPMQPRRPLYRAMTGEFLKIILPLVLVSAVAITAFQVQHYRNEVADLRALAKTDVRIKSESIYIDFVDATADLRALAASTTLRRLLDSGGPRARKDVSRDFLAFAASKRKYDQIRFIDSRGREVIRINYNNGRPAVVPAVQLQNKADRYYFRDTISLARDEVFVSPMDLNIENGRVEQPRKPMIRFGTPLYDSRGGERGVLVINYLGDHFLKHLRNKRGFQGNETMLLNAEGYWLLAPDAQDEWGFMFKNQRRFQNRFTAAWQAFRQRDEGVYQDENGIFAYAVVRPMQAGHVSRTGTSEAGTSSTGTRTAGDYFWILVSYIPKGILDAKQAHRWRIGLLQYTLLLLILIPLTLAFSWAHVRRRAADSLVRKLEKRMRDITRSLAVGLFVLDRYGCMTMMNPEAEQLLGWTDGELYGRKVQEMICPGTATDTEKDNKSGAPQHGFTHQGHYRKDDLFQRKDGSRFHATYVASPLIIDEKWAGNVISFQDISERKLMEQDLERLATLDDLTGLHNRRELNRRMEEEIRRAERYGQYFCVWMLDIDHFKQINDTYGHQKGDEVLRHLAIRLQQLLRDTDIVARFGGEEFVVILSHTSLELAMQMAERVRAAMAETAIEPDGGDNSLTVSVSIGVAAYPRHGLTVDDLIKIADQGLYQAKQAGRNRVCTVQYPLLMSSGNQA